MSLDISTLSLEALCGELRDTLRVAVYRNLAEAMLLSGGLDTSIVATLAASRTRLYGLTVALEGAPNPDLAYARLIAEHLGIHHAMHQFAEAELRAALRAVIRTLRTFDPMEVRNSVAIQIGLQALKEHGYSAVMTGDAGDELFAGYSFFFPMSPTELQEALERMWAIMRFSSLELGRSLDMEVRIPLLDRAVQEFARRIPAELKVRREGDHVYGKWVLRKAFARLIPTEILWRTKLPIEVGTGTTALPSFFRAQIESSEFDEKRHVYLESDHIDLRDPEHLTYYEIFRQEFGRPVPARGSERACRGCKSAVPAKADFCRICGAYPA